MRALLVQIHHPLVLSTLPFIDKIKQALPVLHKAVHKRPLKPEVFVRWGQRLRAVRLPGVLARQSVVSRDHGQLRLAQTRARPPAPALQPYRIWTARVGALAQAAVVNVAHFEREEPRPHGCVLQAERAEPVPVFVEDLGGVAGEDVKLTVGVGGVVAVEVGGHALKEAGAF